MSDAPQRMISRYTGRCKQCDGLIMPGQPIMGWPYNWSHEACYHKAQQALVVLKELEGIMRMHHHIALGCWGIPDYCSPTFTRGEFLRAADDRGELSPEDNHLLRWYWSGILDRDLSD